MRHFRTARKKALEGTFVPHTLKQPFRWPPAGVLLTVGLIEVMVVLVLWWVFGGLLRWNEAVDRPPGCVEGGIPLLISTAAFIALVTLHTLERFDVRTKTTVVTAGILLCLPAVAAVVLIDRFYPVERMPVRPAIFGQACPLREKSLNIQQHYEQVQQL